MAALSNQRHEVFASLVAAGRNAAEAYREALQTKAKSARVNAAQLLTKPVVALRVKELREMVNARNATREAEAAAEVAEQFKGKLMDMAERWAFLALVVRTPVSEIDATSPLCQKYEVTENGTKVWMPDKRACVLDDARLAGELVDKAEVKDTTPRESIESLRLRVAAAKARHDAGGAR